MPRIVLHEFLASGGQLDACGNADAESQTASLRREGAAMLWSIASDFAALDGIEAVVLVASGCDIPPPPGCRIVPVQAGGDCETLAAESAKADWTVVIAPEFEGLLEARCELVERAGGRLLGPSSGLVALAADKQRTAEHLAAAGVPVAEGVATRPKNPLPADFPFGYPAVFKPRDGAGSQDIWLIPDRAVAQHIRGQLDRPGRLERFYPGVAASVAVLCGPASRWPLPPCSQRLSGDGRFHYLGGTCPLESNLADRAAALALRAVDSLSEPLGYIGVDLVLGENSAGRDDVVIEINPRLTTSYVGLRRAVTQNIAAAMLAAAEGRVATVSANGRSVEFDADGTVRERAAVARGG